MRYVDRQTGQQLDRDGLNFLINEAKKVFYLQLGKEFVLNGQHARRRRRRRSYRSIRTCIVAATT